jgi:hypothetical protein
VSTANLQKTDGTGWIPLNLGSIPGGSALSSLPIDPVNTITGRLHYSFAGGGSFQLASAMESARYKAGGDRDAVTKDGGTLGGLYEVGTSFSLIPVDYGDPSLVGYWKFDESASTVSYDTSGSGSNGTMYAGVTPTDISTTIGCKLNNCTSFDGVTRRIKMSDYNAANIEKDITIGMWFNSTLTTSGVLIHKEGQYTLQINSTGLVSWADSSNWSYAAFGWSPIGVVANQWHYITVTKSGNSVKIYLDGVVKVSKAFGTPIDKKTSTMHIGCYSNATACTGNYFTGLLDEVRVFNRALSAAEVQTLYDATK